MKSAIKKLLLTAQATPPLPLATPKIYINGTKRTGRTFGEPLNPRAVTALVSDDANALNFTASAFPYYTAFNGKSLYGHKGWLTYASKSYLNFMHNGADWYCAFRIRPSDGTINALSPILGTNGGSGINTGFFIAYDDRTAQSRTNAIFISVTKGTTVVSATFQNIAPKDTWSTVECYYNSGTLQFNLSVDGVAKTPITRSSAHGTGDATVDVTLFGLGTTANGANRVSVKHLVVTDYIPTAPQRTATLAYMIAVGTESVDGATIDTHVMLGQSNMDGNPTSLAAYPELQGHQTSLIGAQISASFSSTVNPQILEFPVNNKLSVSSVFGPEMRFGYLVSQTKQAFLVKTAEGGTDLYADWLAPSGTTINGAWFSLRYLLADIKYELDKTPVIKSFLWSQGENDMLGNAGANPNYATNFRVLIKFYIEGLNALGYNTSVARWITARTHNNWVPTPAFENEVRADQQNVMDNLFSLEPTLVGKLQSAHWFSTDGYGMQPDTLHFNDVGMNQQAIDFYNILNS
jgi:hypothetical protein